MNKLNILTAVLLLISGLYACSSATDELAVTEDNYETAESDSSFNGVVGTNKSMSIEEAIKEHGGKSPEWIAEATGMSVQEVVAGSLEKYRVPIAAGKFDEVWAKLTEWENPLFITIVGGTVVEVHSTIPMGEYGQGFYNLNATTGLSGHVQPDNIKAIYVVEEASRGGGVSRQVAFYDEEGKRIFGIFVDRDESGGEHYPGTLAQFEEMRDFYKAQALGET